MLITAGRQPKDGHETGQVVGPVSKVFRCEPSGTEFASAVSMTMPFTDDGKGPLTMFWSAGEDPSFNDIGGKADGALMTTTVRHLSSGFVGRKSERNSRRRLGRRGRSREKVESA